MKISACPDGWDLVQSQRGGVCYKISMKSFEDSTPNISWEEARTACGEEDGGVLASIKHKEEAVSFCAKIRTGSRNSVNPLAYHGLTMGLSEVGESI